MEFYSQTLTSPYTTESGTSGRKLADSFCIPRHRGKSEMKAIAVKLFDFLAFIIVGVLLRNRE
jgi:hypothetical protein